MEQSKGPFSVRNIETREDEGKLLSVCCALPLVHLAGERAEEAASKLVAVLNKAFSEVNPEVSKSMQEAEKLFAERRKRKWSEHMYLATRAVLKAQRDNGLGLMSWEEIYDHPDFNFPLVIGSVFARRPFKMNMVKRSIQGSICYLISKGEDIEAIRVPGKGTCYSLC